MPEPSVFQRTHRDSGPIISASTYNLVIGLVLCWGFGINWWMVKTIDPMLFAGIHPLVFFIVYLASCFFGAYLFNRSQDALVSFIGYNFVVIPFGVVVNLVVHQYDPALVLSAMRITGLVTAVMMLLGTLFPQFFRKLAGTLTIALLAVIVVELFEIFVLKTHHGIIDWIVVLIFCGYIGYDWARANNIPTTFDNAVDSAAELYMDIINLFLRILRILGRARN